MKGHSQQAAKGIRPAETQASRVQGALYQVYNFGMETQRLLLCLPPQHCVHKSRSKQEQGESQSFLDKSTWSWASLGGGRRGGRGADLLTLCSLQGQINVSCSRSFSQVLCTRVQVYRSPRFTSASSIRQNIFPRPVLSWTDVTSHHHNAHLDSLARKGSWTT